MKCWKCGFPFSPLTGNFACERCEALNPRFVVCAGLHRVAAVLDRSLDERIAEFDAWEDAGALARQRNAAAGEVETICAQPLVGALGPAPRLRFVVEDLKVIQLPRAGKANQRREVCTAISSNFAVRICNALNLYQPDRRGQ